MPSSVIARFDYDEAARALTVTFTTGRVYRYADVPPALVAAMRAATSKGGFFNRRIRDRFAYVRLV
jgi:nitrous oxide reductase accessory protein NosL